MKLRLTGLLFAAIGITPLQTASAADMPRKAPIYKAPPAAVASDIWSGLYFGGHLGGGWAHTRVSDPLGIFGPAGAFTGDTGSSFIGGPQIGMNWQTGPYVFGIQGDVSFGKMEATIASPSIATETLTAETKRVTTVTGRIGYAWDMWLFYVKGGGAWARTNYQALDPAAGTALAGSATHGGYVVGTGWEWAFAPNWSVFLEYDYIGLGTKTSIPITDPTIGTFPLDAKQDIQMIKTGLNFRFWPGIPAMSALPRWR